MSWYWWSTEMYADKNTIYFAQSDCGHKGPNKGPTIPQQSYKTQCGWWITQSPVTMVKNTYKKGHWVTTNSHIVTKAPSPLKGSLSCAPPHIVERRPTLVWANTYSSGASMSQRLLVIQLKECAGFRDSLPCVCENSHTYVRSRLVKA